MSSEKKTKEETRRALIRAIEEHYSAVSAEEEDPEDQNPGLLMSWALFTEHLTPNAGPSGQSTFNISYCSSDSSPAQIVGVARIGLRRMELDVTPDDYTS